MKFCYSSWQEEEGCQDPPSSASAPEAEGCRPHPLGPGSSCSAGPQGPHCWQARPRPRRSHRSTEAVGTERTHPELRSGRAPSLHRGARTWMGTFRQRRARPGIQRSRQVRITPPSPLSSDVQIELVSWPPSELTKVT